MSGLVPEAVALNIIPDYEVIRRTGGGSYLRWHAIPAKKVLLWLPHPSSAFWRSRAEHHVLFDFTYI